MTIPNYISIFRLMLVPVFVISLLDFADTGTVLSWWISVGAFLVAAVSDGVDGYIARRFKQRSELGAAAAAGRRHVESGANKKPKG